VLIGSCIPSFPSGNGSFEDTGKSRGIAARPRIALAKAEKEGLIFRAQSIFAEGLSHTEGWQVWGARKEGDPPLIGNYDSASNDLGWYELRRTE
jgi:hypothetical protein